MTVVSNVALMWTALSLGDGDGDGGLFVACHVASLCGFLMLWFNMVPEYRKTFYKRLTTQQHVETNIWRLCPPSVSYGPTETDSRARTLASWSSRYWPRKAIVKAWVREHWDEWMDPETRPKWFTEEWRNLFPPGYLPADEVKDPDLFVGLPKVND